MGIKIVPDFQRVTLARYMADTNQPENAKFCTNWVQKFKAMKIWSSFWNRREKERANIEASDLLGESRASWLPFAHPLALWLQLCYNFKAKSEKRWWHSKILSVLEQKCPLKHTNMGISPFIKMKNCNFAICRDAFVRTAKLTTSP